MRQPRESTAPATNKGEQQLIKKMKGSVVRGGPGARPVGGHGSLSTSTRGDRPSRADAEDSDPAGASTECD